MSCVFLVNTSRCTSNCSKAEDKDSGVEEYEVGNSDDEMEEEETDIENVSAKTLLD